MFRTTIGFLLAVSSVHAIAEIECPDETALQLLNIARNGNIQKQFSNSADAYSYVIENASRPMDGPALNLACFILARTLYEEEHCTQGVELMCPRSLNVVIDEIKSGHPILERCPAYAIRRDSWLPIERYSVIASEEILAAEVTGSVEFEITVDRFGTVESASVIGSSDPLLETSSKEAVLKFMYEPRFVKLEPVRVTDVQATVVTDYINLTHSKGCRWKNSKNNE